MESLGEKAVSDKQIPEEVSHSLANSGAEMKRDHESVDDFEHLEPDSSPLREGVSPILGTGDVTEKTSVFDSKSESVSTSLKLEDNKATELDDFCKSLSGGDSSHQKDDFAFAEQESFIKSLAGTGAAFPEKNNELEQASAFSDKKMEEIDDFQAGPGSVDENMLSFEPSFKGKSTDAIGKLEESRDSPIGSSQQKIDSSSFDPFPIEDSSKVSIQAPNKDNEEKVITSVLDEFPSEEEKVEEAISNAEIKEDDASEFVESIQDEEPPVTPNEDVSPTKSAPPTPSASPEPVVASEGKISPVSVDIETKQLLNTMCP